MASKLATTLGKTYAGKQAGAYAPRDPIWETYVDAQGKEKRRRREVPLGLSKKEAKILKKIRKRAHRLDKGFGVCGFRFGYTFILGLIPVVGDLSDAALGYYLIIRPARQCDLPSGIVDRMLFNQAVSTGLGFIPLAGDVFLAAWKTNSRNCALFEDFIVARAAKNMNKEGETADGPGNQQLSEAETKKLADASRKKGYLSRKTGDRTTDADNTTTTDNAHQVPGGLPGSASAGQATAGQATGESGVAAAGSEYGSAQPTRSKSFWSRNKKSSTTNAAPNNASTNTNAAA